MSQQKDNMALIERVLKREDNLYDAQDVMQNVEAFFKTQVSVFDAAVKFDQDLRNDLDYIKKDEAANQALNQVRMITMIPSGGKYDYKRIPELNGLFVKFVETVYGADTLDENLKFIADVLGGKGQPKNVIRNYYSGILQVLSKSRD